MLGGDIRDWSVTGVKKIQLAYIEEIASEIAGAPKINYSSGYGGNYSGDIGGRRAVKPRHRYLVPSFYKLQQLCVEPTLPHTVVVVICQKLLSI